MANWFSGSWQDQRWREWRRLNMRQWLATEESGGDEEQYFTDQVDNVRPTPSFPDLSLSGKISPVESSESSISGEIISAVQHDAENSPEQQEELLLDAYEYPLLAPGEKRLLMLQPGSEDSGQVPLKGSIIHASLNDAENCPTFTALSYVCGPPDQSQRIYLDGDHYLTISAKLHRILTQIRDPTHSRCLWVDAICIDQTNSSERMAQVKAMDEIYAHANYVLSWLDVPRDKEWKWELSACAYVLNGMYGAWLTDRSPRERWRILSHVFSNVYWSRRWVIQEVLKASSVLVCFEIHDDIYGTVLHRFPFSAFGDVLESTDHSKLKILGEVFEEKRQNSLVMRLWREREHRTFSNASLAKVIREMHGTNCSQPNDKVFALLSLVGEERAQLSSTYQTPPLDLLLEVLKISCGNQEFVEEGVMGFANYLRLQLGITRQTMMAKITELQAKKRYGTAINCLVHFRGVATSKLPVFGDGQGLRALESNDVGPLSHFPAVELIEDDSKEYRHKIDQPFGRHHQVSSHDLQVFVWTASAALRPDSKFSHACFSSHRVLDQDEIWQFEDTDLALVLRRTPANGSLRIVGRAQLLNETSPRCDRYTRQEVEQENMEQRLDRKLLKLPTSLQRHAIVADDVLILILIILTSFDDEDAKRA